MYQESQGHLFHLYKYLVQPQTQGVPRQVSTCCQGRGENLFLGTSISIISYYPLNIEILFLITEEPPSTKYYSNSLRVPSAYSALSSIFPTSQQCYLPRFPSQETDCSSGSPYPPPDTFLFLSLPPLQCGAGRFSGLSLNS